MKEKQINNHKELAQLVKRDAGTITRWRARDDWPFGGPPWRWSALPQIEQWIATHLRAHQKNDPELQKAKTREQMRKLRADADTAEAALARGRGDLHDSMECATETARRNQLYRNGVADLPDKVVALAVAAGLPSEAAEALKDQVWAALDGCLALAIGATE